MTITFSGNHPHEFSMILRLLLSASNIQVMISHHTPEFLYEDADELLSASEFELRHAVGETDAHLVCNNARLAITHYLIGYLLEHNIRIKPPASIASLQQQCQVLDPRFDVLELDKIACRYDSPGKHYCLQDDIVAACYKAATELQSIIRDAVPA